MRPIDEILVEHYASHTLITSEQKKKFTRYLMEAETRTLENFFDCLNQIHQSLLCTEELLRRVADILKNASENTLAEIENVLGRDAKNAVLFSQKDSAEKLTQKHLNLILGLETQINDLADAAILLAPLRADLEAFLCSADLATDVTLRHIALLESGISTPIETVYRDLSLGDPSLFDTINHQTKGLEEHTSLLEQMLSDLILSSSRAITAVNKQEQPQTHYLNLLRAEQIRIHHIKSSLLQMQGETPKTTDGRDWGTLLSAYSTSNKTVRQSFV